LAFCWTARQIFDNPQKSTFSRAKHHPSVPNVKLRAASAQEIPPTPLKTKHFREIGFVCSKRHRHITEAAAPATKPPTVPLKADR
jgi:hypothetical protein